MDNSRSIPPRQALGRWGEDLAVRYLSDHGWQVLDRNWRCSQGEVDIVALDGDDLVIVEVKARAGLGYGAPIEAVTARKAARLRRLAVAWCQHARASGQAVPFAALRVDVIGILQRGPGPAHLRHLRAVA